VSRGALAAAVLAISLAAALGGCARSVFPPGGPIDTTPPLVVSVDPPDSAVHVPRDLQIEVIFSESMDRASVRDGIKVYPPIGKLNLDWSGRQMRIQWDKPLAESTTYVLLLSARSRDARGVIMGNPRSIRFSTGNAIDRGKIRGVVRARTLRRQGVAVLAYADTLARPDTTGSLAPSYATETDTAGAYELTGLPANRAFHVFAFYDLNNNGSFEADADLMTPYPGVIRLTPAHVEADSINIVAVDPRAPAILNGIIASHDSTARFEIVARDVADSSLFRRVERVGPGGFSLRVPPGTYRLKATRLATPQTGEGEVELLREEPIVTKPEETYGPFSFEFGEVGERAPPQH